MRYLVFLPLGSVANVPVSLPDPIGMVDQVGDGETLEEARMAAANFDGAKIWDYEREELVT